MGPVTGHYTIKIRFISYAPLPVLLLNSVILTQHSYVAERVPVPVPQCADRSVGCIFLKNKTAADDITVIEREMFFF
jgi:hypothetical protein